MSVAELARWARRFLDAVDVTGPMTVGGHDIGGAVAQHLATTYPSVERLILLNSVLLRLVVGPGGRSLSRSGRRGCGHRAGVA